METVQFEGNRAVTSSIDYYNLDDVTPNGTHGGVRGRLSYKGIAARLDYYSISINERGGRWCFCLDRFL